MIVADASVVLKWFMIDEEDHEKSRILKERHSMGEDIIAAPDLLPYEVANTLLIKLGEPAATEDFVEFSASGIELHSLGVSEFKWAMDVAHRYKITIYDASYVALAHSLRCRFITADERLLNRLHGVPHMMYLKEVTKKF